MKTLTYLTLVITYKCSARCAHCCLGAGPEYGDWMSIEDAEAYIADVTKDNNITWMTLIGGEALLDLERTSAIGETALRYGIPKVELNTNGSWAVDEKSALKVLQRVLDAGLSLPAVSVDAFHQQYVPRERVLCAIQAARELGLELDGCGQILEAQVASNSCDEENREIVKWFGERGFHVHLEDRQAHLVFQGRAANLAGEYKGPRSTPTATCPGVPWFATADFRRLGGIQIDCYGNVMVEHGISIGNAKERPLNEVLGSYDAEAHPIISVLMREGPIGLTRLPEAEGYELREEGYIDKCHLCHEVRTHLRARFPNELCPEQCYPEISALPIHLAMPEPSQKEEQANDHSNTK